MQQWIYDNLAVIVLAVFSMGTVMRQIRCAFSTALTDMRAAFAEAPALALTESRSPESERARQRRRMRTKLRNLQQTRMEIESER